MSAPPSRGGLLLALGLIASPCGAGCYTIATTETGMSPPPAAIARVAPGDPLAKVISTCGPPLELWRHPDGLLLVYRARRYAYDRLGLDPSRAIGFLGVTSLAADALSNLRLTFEWGGADEERVAVLLDREERVVLVARHAPPSEERP